MAGRALGSTGSFLDGLEFLEEFDPANGVLVTGFQAGTCGTVERWSRLGSARETRLSKPWGRMRGAEAIPAGCTVKETNVADAVQTVLQGGEGGALGEEHEDAVEAFVQEGVFFGFKELEAEICWGLAAGTGVVWLERNGHVNTGDSSSCTSLSIWISILTVISNSALRMVLSAHYCGGWSWHTDKIWRRLYACS